ncbi:unnamed protein product [Prunus armeniaca]
MIIWFFPQGEAVAEELADEVATAEVAAEGTATVEVAEMMDAEAAVAEVPAIEEAAAGVSDDEVLAVDSTQAILVEIPSVASAMPTFAVTVFVEPLPSAPRRPAGIVIRSPPWLSLSLSAVAVSMPAAPRSQDSMVVTELKLGPPVSSMVLTELVVAEAPSAPSAAEGTSSSDDLEELYASLHEEGGSSASAPLDEDSSAVIEKLREYIFLGVHQMITAEAFMEFRSYMDTAMALGLLD